MEWILIYYFLFPATGGLFAHSQPVISGSVNGLPSEAACHRLAEKLEKKFTGNRTWHDFDHVCERVER